MLLLRLLHSLFADLVNESLIAEVLF